VNAPRDRLMVLDTCVVSDALDALSLPGAVAGVLPIWEGSKLAGRVVTMRTVPADGHTSHRHLGTAAIERADAGEVIVIEQASGGFPASATWGGLLARAAHLRRIGGVVIDGACRDVDEIRELRLPVSARAVLPFTARGRFVEDTVGEPVVIGQVRRQWRGLHRRCAHCRCSHPGGAAGGPGTTHGRRPAARQPPVRRPGPRLRGDAP
jgi:4-hydroxy-4-methyl-2-oxoglutarate aldolase